MYDCIRIHQDQFLLASTIRTYSAYIYLRLYSAIHFTLSQINSRTDKLSCTRYVSGPFCKSRPQQLSREWKEVIDYEHLKNSAFIQPVLTEPCNTQQQMSWRHAAYSPLMIVVSAAASFLREGCFPDLPNLNQLLSQQHWTGYLPWQPNCSNLPPVPCPTFWQVCSSIAIVTASPNAGDQSHALEVTSIRNKGHFCVSRGERDREKGLCDREDSLLSQCCGLPLHPARNPAFNSQTPSPIPKQMSIL